MLLDPITGAIVEGELARLYRQLFDAEWAQAKARLGRDRRPGELDRTPDQRRADALAEMARRAGTAPADGKAPSRCSPCCWGSDAFSHLSQLGSGQVLSAESILPPRE